MMKNRLAWLIGGAQGSGVDKGATMFAQACAYGGLHIYGQREYYSNIMGEHSYYLVRVDERPVRSITDQIGLLASFDAETAFLHALDVIPKGGIIYDPKLAETPLSRLAAIEHRARDDLKAYLASKGLGETLNDMLRDAEARGVRLFPLPYEEILQKLAQQTGAPFSTLKRLTNTMAVAASLALLNYELKLLEKALADLFKGKQKIIEMNMRACELTYEHIAPEDDFFVKLEPLQTKETRLYLTGNQAVALGKILAGCSFQTYYPISPATDESVYLEAHEVFPQNGLAEPEAEETAVLAQNPNHKHGAILVVQTEDEIAAITMATGAALAGARAATSTSGPGFSLMVEALGWAGINEVPVVVTLYQRGSPSTGLPTRSEQGDLRFALHAGHGEFPRIVLASGDLEECFYDAVRAFNYAERYQLPVIHLLDKSLASSSRTYPVFDTEKVRIERGRLLSEQELLELSGNGAYKRFEFTESGISARSVLGMKGGTFWKTGDEHDEWGHITEDPLVRVRMMEKRAKKLETAAREIPNEEKLNFFGDPNAETLILSWGSPKGPILDAMELLESEGHRLSFLQARLLWPLPAEEIERRLKRAKCRIAVENNFSGQFAGLVREHTGIAMDYLIVKFNGRPMSVDEIYNALKQILLGKAPKKVVLTHGA